MFLIPIRKKLAPGGNWTHTVRAGEGTTHNTRVSQLAKYPNFGDVTTSSRGGLIGKVLTRQLNEKKLKPTGIWTHARRIPQKLHYIKRNYAYTNYTKLHVATAEHRVTDTGKVLKYTFTKTGTWWALNTHRSSGRRYNHITRIKPFAKNPMFGGVTASSRGGMTGKVLTRQLNGRTETGWDLNTRPCNTAKATLHYA